MTEAQLNEVEARVGFALPPEYRRVAVEFPFRPIGRDSVYWFYDDPARVIEGTLAPLADGEYDRAGWRDGFLTIGESAAGDLYILDTRAAGLPVLCLSHETHAIEPEWPTFAAFVAEWLAAPAEAEARQAAEAASAALASRRTTRLAPLILIAAIGVPLLGLLIVWLAR